MYFESLKNSCISEGKLIQSTFLFSFLHFVLVVFYTENLRWPIDDISDVPRFFGKKDEPL